MQDVTAISLPQKALNYALELVCAINRDGYFVYVNEASYRLLGYRPEEMVGKRYTSFVYKEDLLKTVKEEENILADSAYDKYFDNRYVHKDGYIVPLTWSANWIPEEQLMFCVGRESSELFKARKEVIRQEALFKIFDKYGSDIMLLLDADGKYLFVSESLYNILGYKPEELIGTSVFNLIHPQDQYHVAQAWEKLQRSEVVTLSDYRFKAADGQWHWLTTTGSNQLQNPAINAVVISSRDITERKIQRLKIEESEQKFRALFDNNPDLVYYQDMQGIIRDVNLASAALFGIPPDMFIGKEITDLVPEAEKSIIQNRLHEISRGFPLKFEQSLKLHGRNQVDLELTKIPVSVGNQIIGAFTIAKDVTELKSTYKTLEFQAQRLNSVLESITDAFVILDKEFRLVYVNYVFEQISNANKASLLGKSIWEIFPEPEDGPFHFYYERAAKTGVPEIFEVYLNEPDIWLNARVFPFSEGLSVYVTDISIPKRQELLEQLEKEVLEINAVPENKLHFTLDYFLKGLEQIHKGMHCTVMLVEDEKLSVCAAPSLPKGYRQLLNNIEIESNSGSCGTAAFLCEKVIVSDIETDPKWAHASEHALKHNLQACWSVPLISSQNKVLGTFACYYQTKKAPNAEEEKTIESVSKILALIIENKQIEVALLRSNERFSLATDAANDAIYEWSAKTDKVFLGKGFEKIIGLNITQLPNTGQEFIMQFVHPEDIKRRWEVLEAAFNEPRIQEYHTEHRLLKADNTIAEVIDRGKIIRDKRGNVLRVVGALKDVSER
ncbi:MAG: PAS domain S-box protein, partial [Hymenobacteraceae bacterium]|nr:PAS domain S-box protein [Hymenobacteraceae bacterium]